MYLPGIIKIVPRLRSFAKISNINRSIISCRYSTKITFPNPNKKIEKEDEYDEIDLNKPIKYSSSAANKWQAKHSRIGTSKEARLWYEPYVLLVSLSVFLIYFLVLREENDVDKGLSMSLYDRIQGLEEVQLKMKLQYNLDNGIDTTAITRRLEELKAAKKESVGKS